MNKDYGEVNYTRAEWANQALNAFQEAVATDDEDVVCDLLADMMHWCDLNGKDFDAELSRGRMHYEAEFEEDGGKCEPDDDDGEDY